MSGPNPCQHWDHCDCESCMKECAAVTNQRQPRLVSLPPIDDNNRCTGCGVLVKRSGACRCRPVLDVPLEGPVPTSTQNVWNEAGLHACDCASCMEPVEKVSPALAAAIEEAINCQALPGNVHHRLEVAWQAVVGQGRP